MHVSYLFSAHTTLFSRLQVLVLSTQKMLSKHKTALNCDVQGLPHRCPFMLLSRYGSCCCSSWNLCYRDINSLRLPDLSPILFFIWDLKFELWCWRRLLRVPWTARRSNQSILKEISPEYSLEGLMLKLQYCGHLIQRAYSLEKPLMLGKIEGRRRRGRHRLRWLDASLTQWTWVWVSSESEWWTGKPGMLQYHGVTKGWTRLSDWTEENISRMCMLKATKLW